MLLSIHHTAILLERIQLIEIRFYKTGEFSNQTKRFILSTKAIIPRNPRRVRFP